MDSSVSTPVSKDDTLPLASLRLLVPPFQLMTASMWQVLKKQDVMNYWEVAEFVSLVMDMVPELLMYKHRTQLNLGLRARYILELCRHEQPVEPDVILSHLDKIKSQHHCPADMKESKEEEVAVNFLELIQTLLKDPEERQDFFSETFPAEYGSQYDTDLQTLFWEFLCRLAQLLPVPGLEQTVMWLGAESSVLDDCAHSVSEPTHLKNLLQHHKHLGHLEQHVPPSSMGDSILSSLAATLSSKATKTPEQDNQSGPLQDVSTETHLVSFVEDVAVEIIPVVVGEQYYEDTDGSTVAKDSLIVLPEEVIREEEVGDAGGEATHEEVESALTNTVYPEVKGEAPSTQYKISMGPHDCPDCEKKFKFASSLIAHRVIHTGERPHRCNDCGRCFSFRQSLDRHKQTHRTGRKYDCVICGETFHSLSARTVHKQTHTVDGVYMCQQCNRTFSWERTLAKHIKTHSNDHAPYRPAESQNNGLEVVICDESVCEEITGTDCQLQENDSDDQDVEGAEAQSSEGLSCEAGDLLPKLNDHITSPVTVRTSGRKRKPTMKIQVINLKKRMEAMRRRVIKVEPGALKPLPFNCEEHSYGSPVLTSKNSDESSSAAFSCPKCSFLHAEESQVQQHIDTVHADEAEPSTDEGYHCPDCKKSFQCQAVLKAHQRIHAGEQPFLCSQCGRCFSFKHSLERHKQTHKLGRKYECLICGELFKSLLAQREHKSTHMEDGKYVCSQCGRAFAWRSALVRHMNTHGEEADKVETHREERVHTCNCGKSFAYRAALTAHQRIHLKERPHVCTQCGKGFLYKGGLMSHMKIHSVEMPFMCSFCGKSFKRERNMKKHERCHTRENVFTCSQCDKSFVYKATLIRHELTHSGERPYLCSDCGKGFFSHSELLKHERFHTGHKPFQCPHCGKKFTQSCYLTVHLRYHTGVRPYSCSECDKSFLSTDRLKRHQLTHSGEKPYVCGACGKGFRQSYNLKMHQRTHIVRLKKT